LIIVDDGSTDETACIVDSYIKNYFNIKYIFQENKGPAAARNVGGKIASGDFLIFLDADDYFLPNTLQFVCEILSQSPDVDLLMGSSISLHSNGKKKRSSLNIVSEDSKKNTIAFLKKKISFAQGAYAIRAVIFRDILFPEKLRKHEDIVFFLWVLSFAKVLYIERSWVAIRKHQDSLRHESFEFKDVKLISNILFDKKKVPDYFFSYRDEFECSIYLSIQRSAFHEKNYGYSLSAYFYALRLSAFSVFRIRELSKFIRAIFLYFGSRCCILMEKRKNSQKKTI